MCADMEPTEVRTSRTVAAVFLGEGSHIERAMFEIGVRSRAAQGVLWGMWFLGTFVGLLVVAETLPIHFVWMSFLMLPLPLVTVCLLSVDLLSHIFVSLDVYIILILQFAFFVDGIYFCRADRRFVFWCCYLPTMCAALFVDAYPAKYRHLFAKLFFIASLVILVTWNLLLIFKWKAFGTSLKLINISFALHHISDQATLSVFYCRHIWASICNFDHFVMIHAPVLTRKDVHEVEDGIATAHTDSWQNNSEIRQ